MSGGQKQLRGRGLHFAWVLMAARRAADESAAAVGVVHVQNVKDCLLPANKQTEKRKLLGN